MVSSKFISSFIVRLSKKAIWSLRDLHMSFNLLNHCFVEKMPVLVHGSDQGSIVDMATPLRAFAEDVYGGTIAFCGHFLPEEQPTAVAEELSAFFRQG
ncbi:hypothetical protein V1527DRAFT_346250 [Lipomyces starkeyi]